MSSQFLNENGFQIWIFLLTIVDDECIFWIIFKIGSIHLKKEKWIRTIADGFSHIDDFQSNLQTSYIEKNFVANFYSQFSSEISVNRDSSGFERISGKNFIVEQFCGGEKFSGEILWNRILTNPIFQRVSIDSVDTHHDDFIYFLI